LSKNPSKRYPTCREFVNALEAALAKELKLSHLEPTYADGFAVGRSPVRSGPATDADTIIPSMDAPRSPRLVPDTRDEGEHTTPSPPVDRTKPAWKPSAPKRKLTGKPRLFKALAMFLVLVCAGIAGYAFLKGYFTHDLDTLPPNCQKAEDAKVVRESGRDFYDRIYYDLPGGEPIEFVLVPAVGNEPDPYYFMVDKVSVDMFKRFCKENPKQTSLNKNWEKYFDKQDWIKKPIMDVSAIDAHNFAKRLGAALPSPEEWDNASGFNVLDPLGQNAFEGIGPYQPCDEPWDNQIGVGRWRENRFPLDNRQGSHDYHDLKSTGRRIHDLAGNGLEWTSTMCNGDSIARAIGGPRLTVDDTVVLRGFSYTAEKPLQYTYYQFEYVNRGERRECSAIKAGRMDIGFRLVIHPPEKAQ
jgi:formylglycine-generating enzyme required for sulfatase activity